MREELRVDNNFGNNEGNGVFSNLNTNANANTSYGQEQVNGGQTQNYGYGDAAPNQNVGYGDFAQNSNYSYGEPNQNYDNLNQNYTYGQNGYPNGNVGYQYAQQGGYEQELEPPVTVGEWIISMLLMIVPCVNIVLIFVWAFSSSEKKSKSNYFKASLIMTGVVLVLYILIIFVAAFAYMASY